VRSLPVYLDRLISECTIAEIWAACVKASKLHSALRGHGENTIIRPKGPIRTIQASVPDEHDDPVSMILPVSGGRFIVTLSESLLSCWDAIHGRRIANMSISELGMIDMAVSLRSDNTLIFVAHMPATRTS
jgi:hypothetical protein